MLNKIWSVFIRDLRVNLRDFLALYILVVPLLFGFGIQALAPSVNDSTIRLALLESEAANKAEYLDQFAIVEIFPDMDSLTDRIEQRDNVVGFISEGETTHILAQGNEPENVLDFAKLVSAYYTLDMDVSETTATFETFGRTEPPLKKMLVNLMLLMISVLAGMLIAVNIVEEKMDNTVSAINVSPISRVGFILGKSMMGIFLAVYGSIAVVWITGYQNANIGQMLLAILSVTVLSIIVGFIQGLANDDVLNTAAGIKVMFLPIAAAVAAAELLADKWQPLVYWLPFYWSYKGTEAILSYTATWPQILGYTAIILALSGVVYYLLAPKIQAGLSTQS